MNIDLIVDIFLNLRIVILERCLDLVFFMGLVLEYIVKNVVLFYFDFYWFKVKELGDVNFLEVFIIFYVS